MDIQKLAADIRRQTEKIIVGKTETIDLILTAVLAGGHVLLEDLPGTGKTTLVKTLSIALGCSFKRIQFVPDLLPSDITGTRIYNRKTGEFELKAGPVMTGLLLADEINRAIPRTQAALLEAMEERQVSIDGESLSLPSPFVVLATENPIETESTFPLPAAQLDRFLIKTGMGYPDSEEEKRMLFLLGDEIPFSSVEKAADPDIITEAQKEIASVFVSDAAAGYIVALAGASRTSPLLKSGISPRASRAMFRAAKARAAMNGRGYVTPDDISSLAHPVWEHRLVLKNSYSGPSAGDALDEILNQTDPVPGLFEAKDAVR